MLNDHFSKYINIIRNDWTHIFETVEGVPMVGLVSF